MTNKCNTDAPSFLVLGPFKSSVKKNEMIQIDEEEKIRLDSSQKVL